MAEFLHDKEDIETIEAFGTERDARRLRPWTHREKLRAACPCARLAALLCRRCGCLSGPLSLLGSFGPGLVRAGLGAAVAAAAGCAVCRFLGPSGPFAAGPMVLGAVLGPVRWPSLFLCAYVSAVGSRFP